MSRWTKVGLVALVAPAFAIAVATSHQGRSPGGQTKEERLEGMRLTMATGAVRALKASLRNPDSFVPERIMTSNDGDTVCIRYRAQNGFGGMNRETFVMTDQDSYTSAKAWSRRCAHHPMIDYTATLPEMMRLTGQ